jgi:RNA polymerase sigma-70 factor (ECF subfamily)
MEMNMNSNPDTRVSLIARICETGDDDAWTEFVQIYQPVVQRFIQRHGLQYADAAEVTQEVLSGVARSIESFDRDKEKGTFRGWLYRITRNKTIDFLRKKNVERTRNAGQGFGVSQIADPGADESVVFQAEYEKQLFHWAANKLKPTFKPRNWQAFWMSTVDGLSIEEVAEQLQVECGTVYVARSRIMARLSKMIQQRLSETNIG